MNNKKLHTTHKHLTLLFTGVVFIIVMIVGLVFLGAKYAGENTNQKKDIYAQAKAIFLSAEKDDTFFVNYSWRRGIEEVKKYHPGDMRGKKGNTIKLSFFVLDDKNNLIFKELLQEPQFGNINFEFSKIYSDEHTYILTQKLGNKKIIFYQRIRYGLEDAGEDLLLLFILAVLLSGVVYFIGYRFVEKVLLPVENNIQDMTDFVHNAGHELKTPLAILRGNLQVMQAEKKYDIKLIKKSLRDVDNSNLLLEGLIELSQVGGISEKSNLALAVEVRKVVSELDNSAKEKCIEIDNEVQGGFIISANLQELHMLLMNLVKNAIKYNTQGGEVTISLSKNILSIADNGIGISLQDQEKIFERFYQSTTVRSSEGFGIGLSLVKKIADANNWRIELESEEGKGSTFKVIF